MTRKHVNLNPKAAYKAYLDSPEWRAVARLVRERDGYACVVCNSGDNVHVHHRVYRQPGAERLSDLHVLCAKCHLLFSRHGRLTK